MTCEKVLRVYFESVSVYLRLHLSPEHLQCSVLTYSQKPNRERQIHHCFTEWMVGLMGFSTVSPCKRKIATLFAGTTNELISNSDLLGKERQICIISPIH